MKNTTDVIQHIKVCTMLEKKKHFNAADRKRRYHNLVGIPLFIINVIMLSVIFYLLTDDQNSWVKYIPLVMALIASILSGFQTFFNFQKQAEGHQRIGYANLAIMKRCDRLQAYIADGKIKDKDIIKAVEDISQQVDKINQQAESFPTNTQDLELARCGIANGEEEYTEDDMAL